MKLSSEAPEIRAGFCHCGCGQKTKLAPRTVTAYGWKKGEPLRYIHGHQSRQAGPDYRIDPESGCWVWLRGFCHGYGHMRIDGVRQFAHRLVYEQHRGPIPAGRELDHLCRNTACVNPDHLEPVTHAVNLRRGRHAKLTMEKAREIRASDETCVVLAERYGVSPFTISNIRTFVSWREGKAA